MSGYDQDRKAYCSRNLDFETVVVVHPLAFRRCLLLRWKISNISQESCSYIFLITCDLPCFASLVNYFLLHTINPYVDEPHGEHGNDYSHRYHDDVDELAFLGAYTIGVGFEGRADVDVDKILGEGGDGRDDEHPELHATSSEEGGCDFVTFMSTLYAVKSLKVMYHARG